MRQAVLTLAMASVLAGTPPRASAEETLGSRIDAVTARARGALQSATERARAEANEVAESAASTAGEVAEVARERADDARETAHDKAREAGDYGASLSDQVSELAKAQAAKVGSAMSALVDRGKQAAATALTAARAEASELLTGAAAALDRQNAEAKREDRRKHWDAVKARFKLDGTRPSSELSEELRDHAYRVARLTRVRTLAEEADDEPAVARSERLLEVEHARHRRRVQQLREEQRATDGDDP